MNKPTIIVPGPDGSTRAEHRQQAEELLWAGLLSLKAINDKTESVRGMPVDHALVQLAGCQAMLLAAQVHATLAGSAE
jgi:hypothetical protein